jgi:hypothetical protein
MKMMMRLVLAAGVATTVLLSRAPAHAAGYAPWCAVINLGRGSSYWDCQYASIEQCRPHVIAGNRGFCNPNPEFAALSPPPRKWHHRRHGRRH